MILFLDFDGVLHPARAVMGQHGPELAEMVPLLGVERTLKRIQSSLDKAGIKF